MMMGSRLQIWLWCRQLGEQRGKVKRLENHALFVVEISEAVKVVVCKESAHFILSAKRQAAKRKLNVTHTVNCEYLGSDRKLDFFENILSGF